MTIYEVLQACRFHAERARRAGRGDSWGDREREEAARWARRLPRTWRYWITQPEGR